MIREHTSIKKTRLQKGFGLNERGFFCGFNICNLECMTSKSTIWLEQEEEEFLWATFYGMRWLNLPLIGSSKKS